MQLVPAIRAGRRSRLAMAVSAIISLAMAVAFLAMPASHSRAAAAPTTYYISADGGNDSNAGTSPDAPWRTLTHASTVTYQPGDRILLKSGDTWTGESFTPKGSGTAASPIRISSYGGSTKPHIKPGLIPGSNPPKYITYGIRLVDNGGYAISNLEISDTYGGVVSYSKGTYKHDYLSIDNMSFHDITGKDTGFNMPNHCAHRPSWPCYPAPDLHFGTGVAIGGYGNGTDPIMSNISITNSTFTQVDAGIDMTPSGKVHKGMWKNVNIRDSKFTKIYRTGGVILLYVDGGLTDNITVDQAGYQVGMQWGTAAYQIAGVRDYIVQNSEFARTDSPNGSLDGSGFDFESDNHNVTLRGNYIHDNTGPAILYPGDNLDWRGPNSDLVIENNRIHRNNSKKYTGNKVFNDGSNAFMGGKNASAGIVRNNSIILVDDAQSFSSGALRFDGTNTVYNTGGTVVFRGPQNADKIIDDKEFAYRGTWHTARASGCHGGGTHFSGTTGSTYEASFDGSQATLFASVGPANGIAAISIDGGPWTHVDAYRRTFGCSEPIFVTPKLANGRHTVKVHVHGQKNGKSAGYGFAADRLEVAS
jgi:uncharacterized membrane protein